MNVSTDDLKLYVEIREAGGYSIRILYKNVLIRFAATSDFAHDTKWLNEKIVFKCIEGLTVGDVAAASRGSSPPQAVTKLSESWDIMCVTFTTNTWFSVVLTKSRTVFVVCLKSDMKNSHLYPSLNENNQLLIFLHI